MEEPRAVDDPVGDVPPGGLEGEARRVQRLAVGNEPAVLEHEIRAVLVAVEGARVVHDIVLGVEGEHHEVGREAERVALQRDQLLRRAVARDPEVQRLDPRARERRAGGERLAHAGHEGLVLRHFARLGVGIAEDDDAEHAGRLVPRDFGSAETGAVEAHARAALGGVDPVRARPRGPAARRLETVEDGIGHPRDAQGRLEREARDDDRGEDQQGVLHGAWDAVTVPGRAGGAPYHRSHAGRQTRPRPWLTAKRWKGRGANSNVTRP